MTEVAPKGWSRKRYADLLSEVEERAGERIHLPVLSVTKSRGPMLASERFGKVMHGRDLSRYRVASRGHIVADPMLLWDGSIGMQRVVDQGLVSPDYRVYEPDHDTDSDFMATVVRSPIVRSFYQGGAKGTNVRRNRISRADFLAIPVAIPPLPEQRKIAAILSSVDEAIEATQAVIEQLQIVKKAMMAELLTRGIPGRHTKFKMTEIGEVPEEWEVHQIQELVERCDYGISKALSASSGDVAVLRMGNLVDGDVYLGNLKYASRQEVPNDLVLEEGDVLFNRTNSLSLVGKVGLFRGSDHTVSFASYLLRLRVLQPLLSGAWLATAMKVDVNQERLRRMATQGVSQVNINRTKMLGLPIPVPSRQEQQEILSVIGSIDARLAAEREDYQHVNQLKLALMSVLLTGEVRVKVDEDAA